MTRRFTWKQVNAHTKEISTTYFLMSFLIWNVLWFGKSNVYTGRIKPEQDWLVKSMQSPYKSRG
jgi:hypothetical protein